jgi:hypothetical protein
MRIQYCVSGKAFDETALYCIITQLMSHRFLSPLSWRHPPDVPLSLCWRGIRLTPSLILRFPCPKICQLLDFWVAWYQKQLALEYSRTSVIPGGKAGRCVGLINLPPSSWNLGASTFWNSMSLSMPLTGLLYIQWRYHVQWRTQEFFRKGGGVSTNSVEDRGQRERGSGGGSPLVRGSAQFAKWVKPVFWLGCYGCKIEPLSLHRGLHPAGFIALI